MLQGLIGKKTYQSQGFLQDGTRIPLSWVLVADNLVSQVKTESKDGYNAIQIAFDTKKKTTKALEGHSRKAGLEKTPRFFREIRVDEVPEYAPGTKIEISEVLKPGDIVDVTGVSKGKGWAGVVKKWNFKGGPRTHGQSDRERSPGSIGQTTTPGRVYKGKKMGGKMGFVTSTVKNLEVIEITNDGVVMVKGLIPGYVNSLVMINKVGENKKFVPLYREVKEPSAAEALEGQGKEKAEQTVKAAQPAADDATGLEETEGTAGHSSTSDDAQQPLEEQSSDSSSPSESQSPLSEETQQAELRSTLDSSESKTAPVSSEEEVVNLSDNGKSHTVSDLPQDDSVSAAKEAKNDKKEEGEKDNS